MSDKTIQQHHADHVMRSIERQRNEALTREAQKDALISLLQAQAASMSEQTKTQAAKIAELEAQIESAKSRKKRVA